MPAQVAASRARLRSNDAATGNRRWPLRDRDLDAHRCPDWHRITAPSVPVGETQVFELEVINDAFDGTGKRHMGDPADDPSAAPIVDHAARRKQRRAAGGGKHPRLRDDRLMKGARSWSPPFQAAAEAGDAPTGPETTLVSRNWTRLRPPMRPGRRRLSASGQELGRGFGSMGQRSSASWAGQIRKPPWAERAATAADVGRTGRF